MVITGKPTIKGSQILIHIGLAAYGLFTAPGSYLSAKSSKQTRRVPEDGLNDQ
ncbi:MAG: hypothetical protein ABUK20_04350 [Anaerolineales bacterium]